jgi:hypothetical protein
LPYTSNEDWHKRRSLRQPNEYQHPIIRYNNNNQKRSKQQTRTIMATAKTNTTTPTTTTTTTASRSEEANHGIVVPNQWYEDWIQENMKDLDMTGQVAIVTGANSGTGFWAAMAVSSRPPV